MMTMTELYELCKQEEEERRNNPCCANCSHCYREYGQDMCRLHDMPEEDMNSKCEDWR